LDSNSNPALCAVGPIVTEHIAIGCEFLSKFSDKTNLPIRSDDSTDDEILQAIVIVFP